MSVTRRTVKGIDYASSTRPRATTRAYGGATIPPQDTSVGAGTATAAGAASTTAGAGQTGGATTTADRKAPKVTIVKRTVRATKRVS